MPRKAAPPRLYFDNERGTWCILDRGKRIRLGLARGEADAAQVRLAEYVIDLSRRAMLDGEVVERPISRVPIDDVLERYLARRTDPDPAIRVMPCARPREAGQRIAKLAGFFGGKPVSYIKDTSCKAFAAWVGKSVYARRCLADLQAALTEYRKAGHIREVVTVTLPPPPAPREDTLSFAEAVYLYRVCMRRRDVQQRRIGGKFQIVDGRRRLVGGVLTTVDRYVVQFRGKAVDCKGAFAEAIDAAVAQARADDERALAEEREPRGLFLRDDGQPKVVVRHTLRHTGVTWLAETPGVDVEDICAYAGMTKPMFERVYGHDHKSRTRNIVAAQSKRVRRADG